MKESGCQCDVVCLAASEKAYERKADGNQDHPADEGNKQDEGTQEDVGKARGFDRLIDQGNAQANRKGQPEPIAGHKIHCRQCNIVTAEKRADAFDKYLFVTVHEIIRDSKGAADASVFSDAPEMNRQQKCSGQRDCDAVQNIKTIQGYFTDKPFSEQPESRITAARDHVDPTKS